MENKKRPIFHIIAMVVCIILLFFAVVSVVIAINDIEKGDMPYIFGMGICSSNGAYEGVEKNAVVLSRKVGEEGLNIGDVAVFYMQDAPTAAKLYLGSVIDKKGDGTLELYLGGSHENRVITADAVRGKAVYSIAHIGYLVEIFEGRYGVLLSMAITVLLLAVIVLLIGGMIGIRNENQAYSALKEAQEKGKQLEKEYREQEEQEEFLSEQPIEQAAELAQEPEAEAEEPTSEIEESTSETEESAPEPMEAPLPPVQEEAQQEPLPMEEALPVIPTEQQAEEQREEAVVSAAKEYAQSPQEETEQLPIQQEKEQPELPKELNNSYLRGSFGEDRVSFEIACHNEQEAEVMKKLVDAAAKKRNRFGLFTSISYADACVLKVWCEWEDVLIITSIVTEVKKRTANRR